MKKILLITALFAISSIAKSQDLIFNINQSGLALKDIKTGKYKEAEVKDMKATIVLKNNQVIVEADTIINYKLVDNGTKTRLNRQVIVKKWKSRDEQKLSVLFTYTVNTRTKEAMVELTYQKMKSFYFGTYSTSDLISKN